MLQLHISLSDYLQYSMPNSVSLKTLQARSSVNGVSVGMDNISPCSTNSNTKYRESSNGSSSTSINFTTFGWSNYKMGVQAQFIKLIAKTNSEGIPFLKQQFLCRPSPGVTQQREIPFLVVCLLDPPF